MRTPEEARKATAAQARYDAKNTRRFTLKLNTGTDADVIEWLESQPSMQGAVKELIREKLEGNMDSKQKKHAYNAKWEAENYFKTLIRFPIGTKERIAATGQSVNGFVVAAVLEKLEQIESQSK